MKRKKMILDSDMGWDDVLSTLYLLKRPDIEILGVTVTGCGETDLRWGKIIARTLMELGNQTQAKVSIGTSTPLKYHHVFPKTFKYDMNDIMGLLGSLNPELNLEFDRRPAWQFLSETLNEAEEEITILSLGGFTNLAKMLIEFPGTRLENIKEIFAIAGAIFVDGNVAALNNAKDEWKQGDIYGTNYHAEWNVFVDPLAAKMVFESKIPLTLIPLDACDYVILNPDYPREITADDDLAKLAKNVLLRKTGSHSEGIPVPIFDPLATMVMAEGLHNYEYVEKYLDVELKETEKDNRCGKTFVVDHGSRKMKVVQGVSQHQFKEDFSRVMNSKIPG